MVQHIQNLQNSKDKKKTGAGILNKPAYRLGLLKTGIQDYDHDRQDLFRRTSSAKLRTRYM